ncbi:hypothetical protein [Sphingomonas sp.]|uniref:hypothetical protein n=1 Tax=Sphingomonas sp. TaxID=28214 RepID=UPI003B0092E9
MLSLSRGSCYNCTCAQSDEIYLRLGLDNQAISLKLGLPKGHQTEDDRISLRASDIRLTLYLPPSTSEKPKKADRSALPKLLEKQQVFSSERMITDCGIARSHNHVADLALPGITERPIPLEGILIADGATSVPGKINMAGTSFGVTMPL